MVSSVMAREAIVVPPGRSALVVLSEPPRRDSSATPGSRALRFSEYVDNARTTPIVSRPYPITLLSPKRTPAMTNANATPARA